MTARQISLALICLSLAGCSKTLLRSEQIKDDNRVSKSGGLVYSLPKTSLTVKGTNESGVITYTFTPTIVADSDHQYRAQLITAKATDNNLGLTIDADGLLSSTTSVVTDKSFEIATAIAKSAVATRVARGAETKKKGVAPPGPAAAPSPYPFSKVYELTDFQQGKVKLPDDRLVVLRDNENAKKALETKERPLCEFSVCYRPLVQAVFDITEIDGKETGQSVSFAIVDPSRLEGVDITSAPLVTRTTTLAFQKGLLTSLTVDQPSVALAVAKAPLDVVSAILAVPATLLTVKVNNINAEAALAQAQTLLIQQQQALDAARAAQKDPAPSSSAGSGAGP